MHKQAILLISYYFYPSKEVGAKRPSETAHFLADQGFDVTVIRGAERKEAADNQWPGFSSLNLETVVIPRKILSTFWVKLKSINRGTTRSNQPTDLQGGGTAESDHSRIRTIINWLKRQVHAVDTLFQGNKLWLIKALTRSAMLSYRQRIDIVIASGPPVASYVCGLAASKLFKAPLILDFRDPWNLHGDGVRKSQIADHPLANWENSFAQRCVTRSSLIVVASPGIRRHIEETFDASMKPIMLVRNGFDEVAVISERPPSGRLHILYAGSLYWHRNPFPFLEALGEIAGLPQVKRTMINFTMVGNCDSWGGIPLQPWLEDRGLQDIVRIMAPVGADELRELTASSNVLVNFAQGQPRQIPAKSYEYIAACRDLIIVTDEDGDVADLFREAGIGEIVNSDDTEALRKTILTMYEKYVDRHEQVITKSTDIQRYSRHAQLKIFGQHIKEVLAS